MGLPSWYDIVYQDYAICANGQAIGSHTSKWLPTFAGMAEIPALRARPLLIASAIRR